MTIWPCYPQHARQWELGSAQLKDAEREGCVNRGEAGTDEVERKPNVNESTGSKTNVSEHVSAAIKVEYALTVRTHTV